MAMQNDGQFRKSTFSRPIPHCVEVACEDGTIRVRDSKNPAEALLSYNWGEWQAFIQGVKEGEFDLPA